MSEMSSRLFLISPQRMALLSWLSASSSLCLTITSSFWAVSWSWSICSEGMMLPLVEKESHARLKHNSDPAFVYIFKKSNIIFQYVYVKYLCSHSSFIQI